MEISKKKYPVLLWSNELSFGLGLAVVWNSGCRLHHLTFLYVEYFLVVARNLGGGSSMVSQGCWDTSSRVSLWLQSSCRHEEISSLLAETTNIV